MSYVQNVGYVFDTTDVASLSHLAGERSAANFLYAAMGEEEKTLQIGKDSRHRKEQIKNNVGNTKEGKKIVEERNKAIGETEILVQQIDKETDAKVKAELNQMLNGKKAEVVQAGKSLEDLAEKQQKEDRYIQEWNLENIRLNNQIHTARFILTNLDPVTADRFSNWVVTTDRILATDADESARTQFVAPGTIAGQAIAHAGA